MKNDKFKKFTERLRETPREAEPEEDEKADCGNLKQAKGKAYNATFNKSKEEETSDKDQKFLALVAPHEESKGSFYYSESSDEDRKEIKEACKIIYVRF
jgi:hypothetical protein